jgi:sec-independent protein translocase protein TatA
MAGLTGHWWLIFLLLIIVLIIWGPGKLPDVGAGMGRAIREFRKASTETRETIINATVAPTQPAANPNGTPPAQPAPAQPTTEPAAAAPEPAPAGQQQQSS